MPYILTYFLWGVVAVIISQWGGTDSLVKLPFVDDPSLCETVCAGNGVVFRFALCLVFFFSLHVIVLTIPGMGGFHTAFFFVKVIALVGITVWSFWWDSSMLDTFADVARVFSGIFLVVQIVMLIIWAYETNDDIGKRIEGEDDYDPDPQLAMCIIFWCFAFVVGSWILDGFFFHWYAPSGESCSTNTFLIVLTIIWTLVNTVLSSTKWIEHGNLFTAAVVQFYATWVLYTALAADRSSCNTYADPAGQKGGAQMWIGICLITAALSYLGYKTTTLFLSEDEEDELKQTDEKLKGDEESGAADKKQADDDQNTSAMLKANLTFHLIMVFGSFYMAMLLSNWGVQDPTKHTGDGLSTTGNKWIIISAQWFALLLYFWSLIAPKVCTDRDFD